MIRFETELVTTNLSCPNRVRKFVPVTIEFAGIPQSKDPASSWFGLAAETELHVWIATEVAGYRDFRSSTSVYRVVHVRTAEQN
jgi:hypothetical protein